MEETRDVNQGGGSNRETMVISGQGGLGDSPWKVIPKGITLEELLKKMNGSSRTAREGYFEVKIIPGKGLGVVAIRPIPSGTEIHREASIMPADEIDQRDQFPWLVREAYFAALPDEKKSKYLALYSGDNNAVQDTSNLIEKIYSINSFKVGSQKAKAMIFDVASRFNHSCLPNTFWGIDDDFNIFIRTTEDIDVGQELTIAYVPFLRTKALRESELNAFGFTCNCAACIDDIRTGPGKPTSAELAKWMRIPEGLVVKGTPSAIEITMGKEARLWYDSVESQLYLQQKELRRICIMSCVTGRDLVQGAEYVYEELSYKYAGILAKNSPDWMSKELIERAAGKIAEYYKWHIDSELERLADRLKHSRRARIWKEQAAAELYREPSLTGEDKERCHERGNDALMALYRMR